MFGLRLRVTVVRVGGGCQVGIPEGAPYIGKSVMHAHGASLKHRLRAGRFAGTKLDLRSHKPRTGARDKENRIPAEAPPLG